MNTKLISCVWSAILVAAFATGALAQTKLPSKPVTERQVLCWYMVCFGNSVEFYKQEMELAQRHGIDGFLLDVGEWRGNYKISTERMYQAAKELNTGFKLAMAPEYSVQPFTDGIYDMVTKFRDHPNQLKQDGKIVLSGYCNASMFSQVMDKFKKENIPVCLVPAAFFPRFLYGPTVESFQDLFTETPCLDGLMSFNAYQLGNTISDNATGRRVTQRLGKIFAAGVIPGYNSANLQDYRGMSGYIDTWKGAIADGADWISIVIWNDYNEDSSLMPGRWPFGSERYLFDRDESFLDATAYVSAWFKTGREPVITQDKMFVTYRNRSKWMRKGWNGKEWVDICLTGGRFDQIHDDVDDLVYVDTMLTAPASVTVHLGDKSQRFELPAGVGHAEMPMTPGVPRLTLERNKKVLADVIGRKQIIEKQTEKNSLIGYHSVNRTWISGTAIGPVVKRIEAESGTLGTGAVVVTEGSIKAVQTAPIKGSGFSVPVEGLQTGTYNVRITYRNLAAEEARLTLFADGASRAKGDFPYFIPAFLPPTEKGQFQTVSFFWSLYDTTRTLKMEWQPGQVWGQPDPNDDDIGSVQVDAIELVKVEAVKATPRWDAKFPELVSIPGGSFTMGSENGEPDEKPVHKVKVSGFAMGKFEVTNGEYEKFDPTHRQFRNGNSWRDREPVVAVSWPEAAKYCNWLSAQNGLTPAYSEQAIDPAKPGEKFWVADFKADGFRLPTEAEWEYEAIGRGEGRKYVWGNETPIPGVHGRFKDRADVIGSRLPRPSSEDCGTVAVGSYPAGTSRDGVMDMAGNVGEWCTDWYNWYTADAATDPCQSTPGNYRVIRGGSWGWYGYSQRASDREFNSPGYPGYCYYGLRVVVSEAGNKKLGGK